MVDGGSEHVALVSRRRVFLWEKFKFKVAVDVHKCLEQYRQTDK